MNPWYLRWWYCLTKGRPMRKIDREGFWDVVANMKVNYYRDNYTGTVWMAHSSWSLFRVRSEQQ